MKTKIKYNGPGDAHWDALSADESEKIQTADNTVSTAHTPGPWKHDATWGLITHGKTEICALHSGNLANARLIASAPELLAACKTALGLIDILKPVRTPQQLLVMEDLQSAIARAEGGFK